MKKRIMMLPILMCMSMYGVTQNLLEDLKTIPNTSPAMEPGRVYDNPKTNATKEAFKPTEVPVFSNQKMDNFLKALNVMETNAGNPGNIQANPFASNFYSYIKAAYDQNRSVFQEVPAIVNIYTTFNAETASAGIPLTDDAISKIYISSVLQQFPNLNSMVTAYENARNDNKKYLTEAENINCCLLTILVDILSHAANNTHLMGEINELKKESAKPITPDKKTHVIKDTDLDIQIGFIERASNLLKRIILTRTIAHAGDLDTLRESLQDRINNAPDQIKSTAEQVLLAKSNMLHNHIKDNNHINALLTIMKKCITTLFTNLTEYTKNGVVQKSAEYTNLMNSIKAFENIINNKTPNYSEALNLLDLFMTDAVKKAFNDTCDETGIKATKFTLLKKKIQNGPGLWDGAKNAVNGLSDGFSKGFNSLVEGASTAELFKIEQNAINEQAEEQSSLLELDAQEIESLEDDMYETEKEIYNLSKKQQFGPVNKAKIKRLKQDANNKQKAIDKKNRELQIKQSDQRRQTMLRQAQAFQKYNPKEVIKGQIQSNVLFGVLDRIQPKQQFAPSSRPRRYTPRYDFSKPKKTKTKPSKSVKKRVIEEDEDDEDDNDDNGYEDEDDDN